MADQLRHHLGTEASADHGIYLHAVAALNPKRRADGAAVRRFLEAVGHDRAAIEALARHYLQAVARDMTGDRTPVLRKGHDVVAEKAKNGLPDRKSQSGPAATQRSPGRSPSRLDRAAMIRARTATAVEVWHTQRVKCRGNRPWAEIAIGELRSIVEDGVRESAVARLLLREVPMHTSTTRTIAECLPLSAFQRALQAASRAVDEAIGHGDAAIGGSERSADHHGS